MTLPLGETSTADNLKLTKFTANFPNWGDAMNTNLDTIDAAVTAVQTSVATAATSVNAMSINGTPIYPQAPAPGQILIFDEATGDYVPGDPIVSGPDEPGVAPTRPPVQIGAFDGTNVQRVASDIDGHLQVAVSNLPSVQPVSGTVAISGSPAVTVTNLPATQEVAGTVAVSNFPADQQVSGTVAVSVLPVLPAGSNLVGQVDVANFPATQPISGAVTVSNLPATQPVSAAELPLPAGAAQDATLTGGSQVTKLVDSAGVNKANVSAAGALKVDGSGVTQPVSGTVEISGTPAVSVSNLPVTQTVAGTVVVSNLPTTQPVSGTVAVSAIPSIPAGSNLVGQVEMSDGTNILGTVAHPVKTDGSGATQPVSGTVTVSNLPETQAVSGTVAVGNFPGTQSVSGSVAVSNLPATQTVVDSNLAPAITANNSTTTVTHLLIVGGQTNDATPEYQELPLTAGGASVKVDGSAVTQPVSIAGTPTVTVSNLPATQTVSGTVGVNNFPATQPVSRTVAVSTIDNTQLDSLQEQSIGSGNTYTTTGYQTVSFQFAGIWEGSAQILGSNDNVNWVPLWAQNSTDGGNTDLVTGNGIYTAAVSTKYMQYNFLVLNGTSAITVVGKTAVQDDTALLAQSFDTTTGVQINTNIAGGLAKDAWNALVLSDALPIQVMGILNTPIIIDTKGYQTLQLTTQALVASSVLTSNDGINWSTLYGLNAAASTATVTALAASSSYSFPCTSRYVKIVPTTAGTATVFLRNQPWVGTYATVNLTQIANGTAVNAGATGTLAVGGNVAVGAAQTANPLVVGGIDSGSLTRRLLTDTSGRPIISAVDQTATNRPLGQVSPAATLQNVATLAVQDLAMFEGQSIVELLAQILVELKINNYYLFNLPAILSSGTANPPSDEPAFIRTEPSVLQ